MIEITNSDPPYKTFVKIMEQLDNLQRDRPSLALHYRLEVETGDIPGPTLAIISKKGLQHVVIDGSALISVSAEDETTVHEQNPIAGMQQVMRHLTRAFDRPAQNNDLTPQ